MGLLWIPLKLEVAVHGAQDRHRKECNTRDVRVVSMLLGNCWKGNSKV